MEGTAESKNEASRPGLSQKDVRRIGDYLRMKQTEDKETADCGGGDKLHEGGINWNL